LTKPRVIRDFVEARAANRHITFSFEYLLVVSTAAAASELLRTVNMDIISSDLFEGKN
jgi:hypothetical protein